MSNQVYSNQDVLYSDQLKNYSFTTRLLGTVGLTSMTMHISKTNHNTIRLMFPLISFQIGGADTLIENETLLPEQFRPSIDTYGKLYIKNTTLTIPFLIGTIKLLTTGRFQIGYNFDNYIFIAGNSYGLHHCISEMPI